MAVDDPLAALNAIPGELRDTRLVMGNLQEEVRRSREKIRRLIAASVILAFATCGAVSWTAYQQTVLDSKSAAIAVLAAQNAARATEQARNAHNLCEKLNRTRSEILPVWAEVLSSRPDGQGLLERIEAAIPLGKCPKG